MGVVIGVVVGYVLGTRAGEGGRAECQDAWKVVSSSEEVRDLISGGFALGRDLLGRASEALSGSLSDGHGSVLRQVA